MAILFFKSIISVYFIYLFEGVSMINRSHKTTQMNALYLDIGNTSLKLAVPEEDGWKVLWHQRFENDFVSFIDLLNESSDSEKNVVYTSSVRKDITRKVEEAVPGLHIQVLSASQIPKQFINYSTIHTLGLDRFLGCLGAFKVSNKSGVIVIDTGSACTVDFMDKDGIYQGGVIMPGMDILKKSIRRYLPELPDVDSTVPDTWPGKSTQDSLRLGVNGMFGLAIESWIGKFQMMDDNAVVFITGGNSMEIQLLLNDTECTHHVNLQFEGMKEFVEKMKG